MEHASCMGERESSNVKTSDTTQRLGCHKFELEDNIKTDATHRILIVDYIRLSQGTDQCCALVPERLSAYREYKSLYNEVRQSLFV
jgi:hypothetical protein